MTLAESSMDVLAKENFFVWSDRRELEQPQLASHCDVTFHLEKPRNWCSWKISASESKCRLLRWTYNTNPGGFKITATPRHYRTTNWQWQSAQFIIVNVIAIIIIILLIFLNSHHHHHHITLPSTTNMITIIIGKVIQEPKQHRDRHRI